MSGVQVCPKVPATLLPWRILAPPPQLLTHPPHPARHHARAVSTIPSLLDLARVASMFPLAHPCLQSTLLFHERGDQIVSPVFDCLQTSHPCQPPSRCLTL